MRLLVVVLPNLFILSSLAYCAAALTQSLGAAFSVVFLFFFASSMFGGGGTVDPEIIERAALLEPTGMVALLFEARYWTSVELSNNIPAGILFINRAIWLGLTALLLAFTHWRYRFHLQPLSLRFWSANPIRHKDGNPNLATGNSPLKKFTPRFDFGSSCSQFLSQLTMDLRGVLQSIPLYVLILVGIMIAQTQFNSGSNELLQVPSFPVTALMLDLIRAGVFQSAAVIIIYYSAELVHRTRQSQVAEIADASPYSTSIFVISKIVALCLIVTVLLLSVMFTLIGLQYLSGYRNIELRVEKSPVSRIVQKAQSITLQSNSINFRNSLYGNPRADYVLLRDSLGTT